MDRVLFRRRFWLIAAVLLFFCFFIGSERAFAAAGTCTVTYPSSYSTSIQTILVSCTAGTDAEVGTYPDATIVPKRGWVFLAETNPGTTAPTDDYDIVLTNANGVDVMGGALLNRDETNTERAIPGVSGWVDGGVVTVETSNNSVSAATFTLYVWVWIQN